MNPKILLSALFLLAAAPLAAEESSAADLAKGKALHEANCLRCHQAEVYTRSPRMVNSLGELASQVRRCELMLGLKWFDEDIENTAAWLNKEYYKFPGAKP